MKDIIITNPDKFQGLEQAVVRAGLEKLHILSDFERTLTKAFINGQFVPSLISILRNENHLTSDYAQQAHLLYEKYYPIEIDPAIPLTEKKLAMREWWMSHFNLLIKSGLHKKDLAKAVQSDRANLRHGANQFFDILRAHHVPLVIMSASGLGEEAISMLLTKNKALSDNIYIISNSYEWDKNGYAVSVKEPIVYTMNKDETLIKNFPVFEKIKNRKNVLLLGDAIEDLGMIEGFDYENLITIGFFNEGSKENLKYYQEKYDVVILNDGSINYVNNLLKKITHS